MTNPKTVCVVGLGYIGLPTAALLANSGFRVFGCDKDASVVATINEGRIHIVEPDLDAAVSKAVASGMLSASTDPAPADIFMICVPTPFRDGGEVPEPNLDYVLAATRAIAAHVGPGSIIILESTSPVGSTRQIADTLAAAGVDVTSLHIAYCPERVLPGRIMVELVENDRIVGGLTPEATEQVGAFYRGFVRGEVLLTNAATAEMCKLTENSFRDVNIAFANELSVICDKAGIDVWDVIALSNRHPRVNILQPGVGVGGHCIAVDPWFIVASDPANARLIRSAREVNDAKPGWVVDQIAAAAETLRQREGRETVVACLGLAFKPDIDDLRESPALAVFRRLQAHGLNPVAVEPNIETLADAELRTLDEAVAQADILCLLVGHRQFLGLDDRRGRDGQVLLNFCSPQLRRTKA
ncbi:UDP-N-acetyl-D-mannosamine dehydrogenase [Sphingomonas koreensis]|uniref:UDP-N-acetyl-D-mannosamine dehydrogenase n=1 Tax=Sphingomonas koreensis TaxID=93064 RepID=A0A2M8WFR9_9SPHN|nr:UDP-N-acetyl-D-mannosamine dehydrogenase [Sphingomonas koreensis]PJI89781.1 UDP-N-acetyl-D-mannosaminuronic acid dehydrogenase [Sphingomonas koreensis]RSU61896.1 UDP-N-acetyl-D-mannosamine dehydrogenase [Sphingomonas koreensis]RSU70550.1 UDP-N-acetyl-D-mannosamine dehydrogenase [Sphingomonas koreensis]RSY81981.1 UDP-N-acetyl-D-mannosamine dehydrogenase [Sphingomonas koreensis]